jgi:hypothetical protein
MPQEEEERCPYCEQRAELIGSHEGVSVYKCVSGCLDETSLEPAPYTFEVSVVSTPK